MLLKKGKDYYYVVTECSLDPDNEVVLYKDNYIEIFVINGDKKFPPYYHIVIKDNKSKVTALPYTLIVSIPKKKMPNKMVGNFISQDLTLCEYTFDNVGYIVFGKVCTEENI